MIKQILCAATILLSGFAFAQPAFVTDSLDSYINREMQRWQIPGMAVAIVKDGKVVLAKGFGVKEIGKPGKVDEYTLFQIASNSKAFTGTSVSLLNYQKRLLLDEKVTRYMPSFKLYDDGYTQMCTVRDLLCHRIGLQTFQGDFLNWGSNLTRQEVIYKLRDNKPIYPFRYKYGYCNAAFITAGELIKTVTDTTWDDFVRIHFFEPLNMKHTNTSFQKMMSDDNACIPYTLVEDKLVKLPTTNIENMGGAAAINSNVRDMANWLLMQLDSGRFEGRQIVPWEVLRETRTSQMVENDANSRIFKTKHFTTYGLGWGMYDYEGRKIYEHGGGSNGFVTKTEYCPEEKLGIIVYTNTDANSLYAVLVSQIFEAYFKMPYRNLSEIYYNRSKQFSDNNQKELDANRAIVAKNNKPELDLNAYTGKFNNAVYGEIEIKNEKRNLNIYFSHHPQNIGKLQFMENNKFLCTYTDVTCGVQIIPFMAEAGKVKSVTVKVNNNIDYLSYEFEKVK